MTVKECYEAFGGNYDECFSRLRADERIIKFLGKAADDGSFALLCSSLDSRDMPEAFRAAHTLKGICLNLSLTRLYESSAKLTEALRNRTEYGEDIVPLLEQVRADYELTVTNIRKIMPSA